MDIYRYLGQKAILGETHGLENTPNIWVFGNHSIAWVLSTSSDSNPTLSISNIHCTLRTTSVTVPDQKNLCFLSNAIGWQLNSNGFQSILKGPFNFNCRPFQTCSFPIIDHLCSFCLQLQTIHGFFYFNHVQLHSLWPLMPCLLAMATNHTMMVFSVLKYLTMSTIDNEQLSNVQLHKAHSLSIFIQYYSRSFIFPCCVIFLLSWIGEFLFVFCFDHLLKRR